MTIIDDERRSDETADEPVDEREPDEPRPVAEDDAPSCDGGLVRL